MEAQVFIYTAYGLCWHYNLVGDRTDSINNSVVSTGNKSIQKENKQSFTVFSSMRAKTDI